MTTNVTLSDQEGQVLHLGHVQFWHYRVNRAECGGINCTFLQQGQFLIQSRVARLPVRIAVHTVVNEEMVSWYCALHIVHGVHCSVNLHLHSLTLLYVPHMTAMNHLLSQIC